MTEVFTAEAVSPLETLVGEGKKFKTVEDLAKAKLAADDHITRIQEENARLARELAERNIKIEREVAATPPPGDPLKDDEARDSDEEIAELVRKELSRANERALVATNVQVVADRLVELYGDEAKANEVVLNRARELGVTVSFLQDVAAKSPRAFFSTIGLDSATNRPAGGSPSTVNTDAFRRNTKEPQGYAKWEALRKASPDLYWARQLEMHQEAQKMGEAFFQQ